MRQAGQARVRDSASPAAAGPRMSGSAAAPEPAINGDAIFGITSLYLTADEDATPSGDT